MPEVLETPASETPGKETPDTRRVNAMFDKVLRDLSLEQIAALTAKFITFLETRYTVVEPGNLAAYGGG